MISDHRQWFYNGGVETGRIFEEGEEVPKGWRDRPGDPVEHNVMKMSKDELLSLAAEYNIDVDAEQPFFTIRSVVKKALEK